MLLRIEIDLDHVNPGDTALCAPLNAATLLQYWAVKALAPTVAVGNDLRIPNPEESPPRYQSEMGMDNRVILRASVVDAPFDSAASETMLVRSKKNLGESYLQNVHTRKQ